MSVGKTSRASYRTWLTSLPSFSEGLDNLIVTALVKRDDSIGVLSLHRLVQTQYRFFLDLRQRQQAFENAVNLLHEAFPQPNFAKTGHLYDQWAQCRLYSQHILSLKDNFKKETSGAGSLKADVKSCKLLKNFARSAHRPDMLHID